ncbi:uncharacterized protein LOC114244129 [Bombyx mandarina]|uniref:Uncharacterized protein LOC114244129 n=1 Tax=Bombyx mandarina TaxID=7092 RepID=A0A6J2JQT5_BOMMA|nr:uncharacterized protein LOC114244129 [Bombyx mandarina]
MYTLCEQAAVASRGLVVATAALGNNQTSIFVDKLKNILRRNNDDYIDIRTSKTNILTTKVNTTAAVTRVTTGKDVLNNSSIRRASTTPNIRRRALSQVKSVKEKENDLTKQDNTKVNTEHKSILKPNNLLNQANDIKDKYPKYVNKISKVKSFFNKNKDLFKKFISNRSSKPQIPVLKLGNGTTPTGDTLATSGRGPLGRVRISKSSDDESKTTSLEANENSLPNSEQLDMAPARGGYIHAQRLKDRLCQRNVMIPEGPKYDSKGRAYLAAYTAVRGHDFIQTKPPKAFLPRCCNCCKKSVLGCE